MARRTLSRLHGNRMSYSGEKINTKNKNRINDQRDKGGNGQWRCILCQRALKWFPQHQLWENNSRDKKKKKKRAAVNKSNCKRKKKQKKKKAHGGTGGPRCETEEKKSYSLLHKNRTVVYLLLFKISSRLWRGKKKKERKSTKPHTDSSNLNDFF